MVDVVQTHDDVGAHGADNCGICVANIDMPMDLSEVEHGGSVFVSGGFQVALGRVELRKVVVLTELEVRCRYSRRHIIDVPFGNTLVEDQACQGQI